MLDLIATISVWLLVPVVFLHQRRKVITMAGKQNGLRREKQVVFDKCK